MTSIPPEIIVQLTFWRQNGETIVLATGVFDLLHEEHRQFLLKAKQAGTKLVVGVETDERVKIIKGPSRPLQSQHLRLTHVQALPAVDAAFLLPAQFTQQTDWEQFMALLHPHIYAVSSHTNHLENKRRICTRFGVDLQVVHRHNPAVSSTQIINQLKK